MFRLVIKFKNLLEIDISQTTFEADVALVLMILGGHRLVVLKIFLIRRGLAAVDRFVVIN